MAKLYFKYGAMGSSKSAQALITKFNYEELGMKVFLLDDCIINKLGEDISVYPHGSFDELIKYVGEINNE